MIFKKLFKREYMVSTPVGQVKRSDYEKHRFVSVREELVERELSISTKHYNKFGEMYSETVVGITRFDYPKLKDWRIFNNGNN